jgi:hypothetical protein
MIKEECYMSLVKFLYRNLSQANLVRGDSLFNFYIPLVRDGARFKSKLMGFMVYF